MSNLLEINNLTVQFRGEGGWFTAVDDVSLALAQGETLGIVGESCSGKSVTALSILRLHAPSTTRPTGQILYSGKDMLTMTPRALRAIRAGNRDDLPGPDVVAQSGLTIADQIGETLRIHQQLDARTSRQRAIELLELVRIPTRAPRR